MAESSPASAVFSLKAGETSGVVASSIGYHILNVIEIDPERRIAEVEGMTTFEDFADAALFRGFRPPVVPELKTITVGVPG